MLAPELGGVLANAQRFSPPRCVFQNARANTRLYV